MCAVRSALIALACTGFTGVRAQEAEPPPGPGLEFLEYLGAWAEEDDEWIAIEEWEKGESAAPDDDRDASEKQKDGDDEDE
jgi:hypothetical protein